MRIEKVTTISCGWALPDAASHGTCIALHGPEGAILVDAAGDVAQGLAAASELDALQAIYLTHEHTDHLWGLPGLLHALRFAGSREVLTIKGPPGAIHRARAAVRAFELDPPYSLEWAPLEVTEGGDGLATWAPTEHTVPTLAYRFDDVVVCGDTAPSSHVSALACGAGLLLHEASHDDATRTGPHGHSTPAEAGRTAAEASVGALCLTHIHPSLARARAVELAAAEFSGPILAPVDGDVLHRDGPSWSLHGQGVPQAGKARNIR